MGSGMGCWPTWHVPVAMVSVYYGEDSFLDIRGLVKRRVCYTLMVQPLRSPPRSPHCPQPHTSEMQRPPFSNCAPLTSPEHHLDLVRNVKSLTPTPDLQSLTLSDSHA